MEIFAIQTGRLCSPALVVVVQSSNLRHLNHLPRSAFWMARAVGASFSSDTNIWTPIKDV